MNRVMPLIAEQTAKCQAAEGEDHCPVHGLAKLGRSSCNNGKSNVYPCRDVDLQSFISLEDMGTEPNARGNDIWGWTDETNGNEYAVMCSTDGTAFVDISVPENPKALGFMEGHTVPSSWRDVKVYKDHAFVVSEASNHGMQIFDLKRLRGLTDDKTRQFTPDAFYDEVTSSHNIVINEETGYAYLVGTRTCSGGLHMVDIRNPKNPEFVGCYSEGGYTHDSECVIYKGLDTRYVGKEICFNYNEDELVIADVTDKSNVITISRTGYNDDQYTHQGWLTEDHTTLLMNDELDELYGNNPHTRTLIWSVFDLENPINTGNYFAENTVIDHNLYIKGNLGYLSNYCDGLRVFDVSAIKSANIQEKAFYDINPSCDTREFSGTWSNFPYFPSGNVIVSSIERGLFVVKVNKEVEAAADARKAQIDEMYAKGFSHSQVNEAVGLDSHIVHTQDFMMTMEAPAKTSAKETSTGTTTKSPTSSVVGGVAGSLALVALVAAVAYKGRARLTQSYTATGLSPELVDVRESSLMENDATDVSSL
jgi:choice-of-anchor B domain-containing protein